jgi:HAD superfamily hydrolase (TIGR01490 family)
MEKRLVLLDFDGTITRNDTLFEFIRFYHGDRRYYGGIMLLSPVLMALRLRLISKQRAKERVLRFFFSGTPLKEFNTKCTYFATNIIPRLIRASARALISRELNEKSVVVVVSASPENWVKPWCDGLNIHSLATRLEIVDDKITGRIYGSNCRGEEKVRRIRAVYELESFQRIVAYGDSRGDREMLALADEPHFRTL